MLLLLFFPSVPNSITGQTVTKCVFGTKYAESCGFFFLGYLLAISKEMFTENMLTKKNKQRHFYLKY